MEGLIIDGDGDGGKRRVEREELITKREEKRCWPLVDQLVSPVVAILP
jgi:hypothetical protein